MKDHFKQLNYDNNNNPENQNIIYNPEEVNEFLDKPFTEEEIQRLIRKLENGKSSGEDDILNEFLKNSSHGCLELYVKLFNLILETGIVPDDWCTGFIIPLYKGKGSKDDVNNYRGIRTLSCLGILFTGAINHRLKEFLDRQNVIGPEQAGFKKDHSILDHIFVLKTVIDIYLSNKKRLYACFVDYEKAFDKVDRLQLWIKLLNSNISGKIFNVVHNLYAKAKSRVFVNGELSNTFPCQVGVRQGDSLSPLLFPILLSDLNKIISEHCEGLKLVPALASEFIFDEKLLYYLKLYILMYADDTVVLAESEDEMQKSLNTLHKYCEEWKLKINVTKTKIMIFSRGKVRSLPDLMFGNSKIEVVFEYNYLGIILNYNGNFTKAIKSLYDKGSKAMFFLLITDLQLHLFDKVVTPVILYGCEVWGFESCKKLDKLQIKFCKYILKLNKSICSNMIYGELGVIPISVQAKCRLLNFWAKLVDDTECKLSNIFYYLLYKMDEPVFFTSNWIRFVKNNLNALGFSELYTTENIPYSSNCFKNRVQLRTTDQFRQNWASEVFDSSKCLNYRMFKTNFEYEN